MTGTDLAEAPISLAPQQGHIAGPPIFFMHIAKTAGSYLNRVLEAALGTRQVETHVEHRLGGAEDLRAMLSSGRSVISGHVMKAVAVCHIRPNGGRAVVSVIG